MATMKNDGGNSGKAPVGRKFGDDRRTSMAKPSGAKSPANVAARTAGLGKQGLIKGQPSGAGVKGGASVVGKAKGTAPARPTSNQDKLRASRNADRVAASAPKKKFGDSNRSSMAPKAKPGSNYGPGKIPTAGKPNQGKFDTVAARTVGLAKQGLIKGQPSGAGIKGNKATGAAPKKPVASAPVKKKPVAQPATKPAAKAPASTGGGGRPAMKMY
jgi:hypothetical protein